MKVTQLFIYPIKSLRPIIVGSSELTFKGFNYDRRFILLKVHEDGTLSPMQISKAYEMALFHCSIKDKTLSVTYHIPDPPVAPDTPSQYTTLEIPLEPDYEHLEKVPVSMYTSAASAAYKMEEKYNHWFSECFGYECILVYLGNGERTPLGSINPNDGLDKGVLALVRKSLGANLSTTNRTLILLSTAAVIGISMLWQNFNSDIETTFKPFINFIVALGFIYGAIHILLTSTSPELLQNTIGFSDCAPFLIVTESSLNDVHPCLGTEKMIIEKFRPNIVIDGEEKWDEDFWGELIIGDKNRMKLTANCARCVSLNVDLETGRQAKGEAGKVLKKLMSDRRVDRGFRFSPIFGRYGFPVKGGVVSVGDGVRVSRRNRERTTWYWPVLGS